mmetsp:Transcript_15601/g.38636  ORF Transcript_15601/g.38636 Transcript_15601/m.38636 type:complete len:208 (-) Transcript_15601:4971-5594(-)
MLRDGDEFNRSDHFWDRSLPNSTESDLLRSGEVCSSPVRGEGRSEVEITKFRARPTPALLFCCFIVPSASSWISTSACSWITSAKAFVRVPPLAVSVNETGSDELDVVTFAEWSAPVPPAPDLRLVACVTAGEMVNEGELLLFPGRSLSSARSGGGNTRSSKRSPASSSSSKEGFSGSRISSGPFSTKISSCAGTARTVRGICSYAR